MDKVGRNDPCPCGSGKKYKKCCEAKAASKHLTAHKIENASQVQKAEGLSNIFKSHISPSSPIQDDPSSKNS